MAGEETSVSKLRSDTMSGKKPHAGQCPNANYIITKYDKIQTMD